MKSEELQDRFNRLNVWKSYDQRAPHKPLLVLWAIGRCLRGEDRLVSFKEASHELAELLRLYGPPRKNVNPEYPFWRLRSDGVWEVLGSDRISETVSKDAHVSSLLKENAHGGFPKEINDALQADKELAVRIAQSLLDAHFSSTRHDAVLQDVGIGSEFEYIRRRIRNRDFSDTVLAAYGHQCAVCEFAIRLDKVPIGLEAAHIRWHCAKGPDLIQNALSLCSLHHTLFDAGAFTLYPERRILVSGQVTGRNSDETLGRYQSKEIILPEDDGDFPNPEFLNWHHNNVFQDELRSGDCR